MKKLFVCLLLSAIAISANAQNDDIAPSLSGSELVAFLQANFSVTSQQSYNAARDAMFSSIDNKDGVIQGVYSGYEINTSNRTDAQNQGFNTEHSWPQSFYDQALPMRSDIHHLYPTLSGVNSARSNFRFDEIPDQQTDRWYRGVNSQTAVPNSNIDEYSELNENISFEPREDHKGNVARAMFYFWAIYQNNSAVVSDGTNNESFFNNMKDVLLEWHRLDPVDSDEVDRSIAIEGVQGNRNPFVHDTTLVRRAFFESGDGGNPGVQGSETALIITGVIDGPLTGGTPKAVELFVIEDISDLSRYAIGSANNGGGSDGAEFQMSGSASANDYIYITTDNDRFVEWFDFDATFVSDAVAINGDDAIELFFDSTRAFSGNEIGVDVFGDINTDGSGQAWEYMNGWAYREDGTRTDSTIFNLENWVFSGVDALNGSSDNGSAQTPFPGESFVFDIVVVSNENDADIPITISLDQNYPNPFNPSTQIRYELQQTGLVQLAVYDMLGREVQRLVNSNQSAGAHQVTFDATGLSSGLYVYQLRVNEQVLSRTMMLIK